MNIIETKSDAFVILIVWSGAFLGFPTVYLLEGFQGVEVYFPIYVYLCLIAYLHIQRELRHLLVYTFQGTVRVLTLPLEAVRTIRQ